MKTRPKTKLSVYLIKETVIEDSDILSGDFEMQPIESVGRLYSKASKLSVPKWVDTFFGQQIQRDNLYNSSASAVLLVPVLVGAKRRTFACTFGRGFYMLDRNAIEPRFGLKTVLNCVESDSIRKISKTVIAGNASKSNEQLPKRASINEFALDIERDLLEGVTAVCEGEVLSGNLSGSDALGFSTEAKLETLPKLLEDVAELYASDRYKKEFPWVDHIEAIKNGVLKGKLDEAVVSAINDHDERIWMAVPEVIEWEKTAGFKYRKHDCLHDDILIEEILDTFQGPLESIDQLKHTRIDQISSEDDTVIKHWTAYHCLYGELPCDGGQYCINGGSWYKVDQDYVEQVNAAYEAVAISSIPFVECTEDYRLEAAYNRHFCECNPDSLMLMDKKNISFGGGGSRVELCDVLADGGRFIHIKNYSGSDALSHLFNQGLVSAELVRNDAGFREKANEIITSLGGSESNFKVGPNDPREVVYGIMSKVESEKPAIPFFSKITLHSTEKRLRSMGIMVSIAAIPKEAK